MGVFWRKKDRVVDFSGTSRWLLVSAMLAVASCFSFGVATGSERTTTVQAEASTEPPSLSQKHSNTGEWLQWAEHRLAELSKLQGDPSDFVAKLKKAMSVFDGMGHEVSLKNSRHHGDLQSCGEILREALALKTRYAISKAWSREKLEVLKRDMLKLGGSAENMMDLYRAMGDVPSHLKAWRQVLEIHERNPAQLKKDLVFPPMFGKVETYSLETCHDVVLILDLSLKKLWRPEGAWLSTFLLKLSKRYETLGALRFGLEVLLILDEDEWSDAHRGEVRRLRELSQAPQGSDSLEALY